MIHKNGLKINKNKKHMTSKTKPTLRELIGPKLIWPAMSVILLSAFGECGRKAKGGLFQKNNSVPYQQLPTCESSQHNVINTGTQQEIVSTPSNVTNSLSKPGTPPPPPPMLEIGQKPVRGQKPVIAQKPVRGQKPVIAQKPEIRTPRPQQTPMPGSGGSPPVPPSLEDFKNFKPTKPVSPQQQSQLAANKGANGPKTQTNKAGGDLMAELGKKLEMRATQK
ncbi:hypothetical protein [Cardinium endosymbiont of Tipula unca]|uniref:hypothetical protein n=1 Tax=Cardinium endosymbiont of Tipula unca TaxID=3066216 RepID=UPI0030CA8861